MADRILIVEDEPMNVKFMRTVLVKKGGFDVFASEDVPEILRIAETGSLVLIVMDIGLNNSTYQGYKVDGVRITQLLKSNPATRNIPVLLATAFAMAGDRARLLEESGADGYIAKPIIDPSVFMAAVHECITPR